MPLTPPDPKPSTGRRRSGSITNPGMVFTREMASAPASTAVRALATRSGSVGESLTKSGSRVAARAWLTTSASAHGSAPNSIPPACTFGQLTLSSKAETPGESFNSRTTSAYSCTWSPTTFTSTRAAFRCSASQGSSDCRTTLTPGLASPIALTIPPANSATRGEGAPWRGCMLTALVTNPPSSSRSITRASSRPYAAVPAASTIGF